MKTRNIKPHRIGPFRPPKTLKQIAREQGAKPLRWEKAFGAGAGLWDSNAELEQFLKEVRKRRQQGK